MSIEDAKTKHSALHHKLINMRCAAGAVCLGQAGHCLSAHLLERKPLVNFRFSVEFQWFLTELSVRPGRNFAMTAGDAGGVQEPEIADGNRAIQAIYSDSTHAGLWRRCMYSVCAPKAGRV